MGREIKRVDSDFRWPARKVWPGYDNPFYVECPVCEGDSEDDCDYGVYDEEYCCCFHPSFIDALRTWKRIEPPSGDGYQLWENVSEGSPVSPVLASLTILIMWMKQNNYSKWAIADVEKGNTYLPSAMILNGEFKSVQE